MKCKCRNIVEIEINEILEKFDEPKDRSIIIGMRRRLLDKLEEYRESS